MRELLQAVFAPDEFDEACMNLHLRSTRAKSVAVFVHGLGGHGYKTWGNFPHLLYSMGDRSLDVACFDYRSGPRALRAPGGGFRHWADQLGGHLAKLQDLYDDILLIGHSQGGIVIEAAVQSLYVNGTTPEPLRGIAALILLASPRAGTRWVPRTVARLVPALAPLAALGGIGADIERFFTTHVDRHNVAVSNRTFIIPTFAAIAGIDRYVDELSAAHSIPSRQRKRLTVAHTKIARPVSADSEVFRWVRDTIAEVLDVREQAHREARHRSATTGSSNADRQGSPIRIVAELSTDPAGAIYEDIYAEERSAASDSTLVVVDVRDHPGTSRDLIVAAHDSGRVIAGERLVRSSVEHVYRLVVGGEAMSALVCPVGDGFVRAADEVVGWLVELPPARHLYVNGTPDLAGYREQVAMAIYRAIARNHTVRVHDRYRSTLGRTGAGDNSGDVS